MYFIDLNYMNILIVGASYGIGENIVKLCLDKGDQVFTISRTTINNPKILKQINKDVSLIALEDLTEIPEVLDAFVYCPGSIALKPFNRFTENDFLDDYKLNVTSGVKILQLILPNLKKSEQASVLFFSTVAVGTGMPYHSLVASSKGAIEGLTRALAAELAPKIRVNAIAPSITDTPLASKILSTDEKKQASGLRHPLQKIGNAEDIGNMAYFLLSNQAKWITGQIIHVDGGMGSLKTM